jgi:hypothetical protein
MSGGGVAMDRVAVFVWKNISDFGAESRFEGLYTFIKCNRSKNK